MSAKWFLEVIHKIEDGLVALLLMTMMGLAITQIVLRNFWDTGLSWADSLLRVMVLWVALIGAMVATRQRQHISMDVVARFMSPRRRRLLACITDLFAAAVCFLLSWYSWVFVAMERESPSLAFGAVPSWWCEMVMPVAFGLMGCRFCVQVLVGPPAAATGSGS